MLNISRQALKDIDAKITTEIFDVLVRAANAGSEEAVPTASKWGAPRKADDPGLHFLTYRAICCRDGRFAKRTTEHNFNGDLAAPFMRMIDPRWNKVFNRNVLAILWKEIQQCKGKIDAFQTTFGSILTALGYPADMKEMFENQLESFVKSVNLVLQDIRSTIKAEQKVANRLCTETIQREMNDVYLKCASETGEGCFMRMKNQMQTHLESCKDAMFDEVRTQIRATLLKMMEVVKKTSMRSLQTACEEFRRDCGYLISREGREFGNLDEGVRNEILSLLEEAKASFDAAAGPQTASLLVRSATPGTTEAATAGKGTTDWGEELEGEELDETESETSDGTISNIEP